MTPKEKAASIMKTMFNTIDPHVNIDSSDIFRWKDTMKQCALIAVDEIINSEPQKPLFKTTIDVHGVKEDIHDYPPDLFWQDVKEEIIRL